MNMIRSNSRTALRAVALGAIAGLLSVQALAAEPAAERSVTVSYRDLNLSSVDGASTLYQRIRGAARLVCGESGRGIDEQRAWRACYEAAVTNAIAAVNSPVLNNLANAEQVSPATAML
jgi:UrcA family protein